MLKKKVLCSLIALSMATVVAVPVTTVNVMAETPTSTTAGVISSNLLTAILGNLNNAGLTTDQKLAIVASFKKYLNGSNDQVIKKISDALGADCQTIQDKFGITSASINAVVDWFKSLTLSDLVTINGGAGSDFDALNSSLRSKLIAAGVSQTQFDAFTAYLNTFNKAITTESISTPVLVDSTTSGQIKVNTSGIDGFVSIINKYDDKTKNIANSTNVTALLNIFVEQYNAADTATKDALKTFLTHYNIYGVVTTNNGTTNNGTTNNGTETDNGSSTNIDSAAHVPVVVNETGLEVLLNLNKPEVEKAIEAVLAAAAKSQSNLETKITIEAPATVTKDTVSVPLAADIVDLLKTKKIANVEVKVSGGVILIPVELLTSGKDIKLTINKVAVIDAKKAADAAKELAGGTATALAAFDYKLLVGGEKQTTFTKPVSVTVTVDSKTAKADSVAAYYIDDNGKVQYIGGKYANGVVTFKVKHFSEYVVMNYTKDFSDVSGNWIASTNYLQQAVKRLIAKGDANGKFNPDNSITRAEFAAFIARTLQLDTTKAYAGVFSDVKADAWYAPEVEAVKAAGIIDGIGNGKFDPNAQITREQMAKMIASAYSNVTGKSVKDIIGTSTSKFSDFDTVSSWAKDYVAALETLNVVAGNNGAYSPLDKTTRAQSVKVIVELANKSGLE